VARLDHWQLDVLQQIVPEAILCCKDINEQCRSAAYSLLVLIGHLMQVKIQFSVSLRMLPPLYQILCALIQFQIAFHFLSSGDLVVQT
jgi:hypothetical protein